MTKLKKVFLWFLSIIFFILLIPLVINNFIGFIGLALVLLGIYEWNINRKLGAKSKVPGIVIIVGLIISIGWFASVGQSLETTSPTVANNEKKNEEIKIKDQSVLQQENKQTDQTQNNAVSTDKKNRFTIATITEIVDGDTMKVNLDGREETIRLLLVDTPETKDPNEQVQPFGPEATNFAKQALEGKEVKLESDGPERDKYNRLLVYLWIGDKIFNQMLLENGLARVAYVYDPPYTHYDAFVAAEKKAKDAKLGIWSIPGYVIEDGYNEEAVAAKEEPKKEEVQQKPTQQNVYYKNCTEARRAGAAPLYRGDPGYRPELDRDHDGIACE